MPRKRRGRRTEERRTVARGSSPVSGAGAAAVSVARPVPAARRRRVACRLAVRPAVPGIALALPAAGALSVAVASALRAAERPAVRSIVVRRASAAAVVAARPVSAARLGCLAVHIAVLTVEMGRTACTESLRWLRREGGTALIGF